MPDEVDDVNDFDDDVEPWNEGGGRQGDYSGQVGPDMIDFPVSDLWQDHYHRAGLTPYGSGRLPQRQAAPAPAPQRVAQPISDGAVERLWDAIRQLETEIREMKRRGPTPTAPAPKRIAPAGVELP